MIPSFAEYLQARLAQDSSFRQAVPAAATAFQAALQNGYLLGETLTTHRDASGHSHVSLAPFHLIFLRQMCASFEALSVGQAFQAWVSIRPGIESVLIMGKWVADPKNADIWENRVTDPRAYLDCYQGKNLGNGALPRGNDIQTALKGINDNFLHPNPYYYFRHLHMDDRDDGNVELRLDFFDHSDDVWLGFLGILHLVVVCQDSVSRMFTELFVDRPSLDVGVSDLESKARDWVRSLRAKGRFYDRTLTDLGLWPRVVAP